MTRIQTISSIAALMILLTMALPTSGHAQTYQGAWTGVETDTTKYYVNGIQTGETITTTYPSTMTLEASSAYIQLIFGQGGPAGGPGYASFGAQSGGGSYFEIVGDLVFDGSVGVTYQSILPDGMIDTANGTAFASAEVLDEVGQEGSAQDNYISFNTVPEPSSVVELASGILAILILARGRRFFSR